VTRDEPALELALVEQGRFLAQRREHRVWISEEGWIGRVEAAQVSATIVIPPRAF
jgi:hypothetical protein